MQTLAEAPLSDADRTAIEAASAMLRQQFPVERVVLFGSKARGEDDAESDIDLLVLTRHPLSWQERDKITSILFGLELELDVVISTMIVSVQEWDHGLYQVLPIREEIERDGVRA